MSVRWGILSTAKIGMEKVTPAIAAGERCDVVAIASRSAEAAEAAAGRLGIGSWHGSYEALIEDENVDAIYVPLPNDMHAEWTIKAMEAGKHVLCEKPLAMDAGQAREMVAASEQLGRKLGEAFMYRHHPSWVEACRLVESGAIGELQAVQSWFSYFNDDPSNIRNRPENGGGALMDIGCYSINLSRMLFGAEPDSIAGSVRRDPTMGIDVVSSGVLGFPGGGQATFTCAIRTEEYQHVLIMGSEGRIEIEIPFNIPPDRVTRIFHTQGGDAPVEYNTRTIEFDPVDQYTIQAELFAAAVLDDTAVAVPLSDAIANMEVIDALLAG